MSAPNTSAPKLSAFNESNKLSTSKHRMWKSFLLGHNSKLPAKNGEWNKVNRYKWKMRSFEFIREKNINKTGINFGIPCGLVNKCFVLDMDLYKLKGEESSEFIKRFGEDYVEYFNTLTVKTGSGGEHLYFKYDNDIKTTICAKHEIDIRSNGSYAVAPGSCIWSPQQIKEYKVIRDTPMITVPAELKDWILSNLYKQSRKVTDKVIKDKNGDILNPVCKKQLSYQNEVDLSVYNYSFSDTILRKIFDTLDNCFYEEYDDFLIIATCLKTMNKREYFEEICKTKLDPKHLKASSSWGIHSEDMWNSVEYKAVNTLPFILRESGFMEETLDPAIIKANDKYNTDKEYREARSEYYKSAMEFKDVDTEYSHDNWLKKENRELYDLVKDCILYNDYMTKAIKDFLGYYMYKPTNNHTIKPDKIIKDQRYLDGDTPGSFIQQFQGNEFGELQYKLVIVKSDTGTGKTTAMKNYFKLHPEKCFISIVSRLSLGKEQTVVFKKSDIDCYWFRDEVRDLWRMEGENIVIQIDSLNKLASWCEDCWNAYTIYLDEFNSLIEYFIDCPNLDDKRITVKRMLERIIIGAEQVIMTDAHISDTSLLFLKQLGIGGASTYIENDYKHNGKNGGIKAREVYDNEDLVLELQKKLTANDPFMVCCDSKNVCDVIHHELGRDKRIGIFTSETMEDIDLDAWDFVIFSPKIVYGLDSVMARPVYCVMKEHTISPLAMIQQANRCRSITELVYFFGRKSHGLYKYENKEEVLDQLNNVENNADSTALASAELLCSEDETKKYKELLAHHMYVMDCFNTNKFSHFLNLLREQGFNVDIHRETTSNSLQSKSKEVKKYKQDALKEMFKEEEEPKIKEWTDSNFMEIRGWLQDERQSLKQSLKTFMECEDIEEKIKTNTLHNSLKEQLGNYHDEIEEVVKLISLYGSGEKGDLWLSKNKDELIDNSVYPKYIQNNIKLLNIQPDKVGDYEKILIDNHKITNHFRICKFFFKEDSEILKKLEEKKDYNCKKGASCDFKILYLKKVLKTVGIEGYNLDPDCSGMDEAKSDKLLDEYRVVFTDRNKKKKLSFEDPKIAQQLIVKMYKNIFGADIMVSKKSTQTTEEGVKSVTRYSLNMDKIMESQDIYTDSMKAFQDGAFIQKSKLYSKIVY